MKLAVFVNTRSARGLQRWSRSSMATTSGLRAIATQVGRGGESLKDACGSGLCEASPGYVVVRSLKYVNRSLERSQED